MKIKYWHIKTRIKQLWYILFFNMWQLTINNEKIEILEIQKIIYIVRAQYVPTEMLSGNVPRISHTRLRVPYVHCVRTRREKKEWINKS